MQELVTASEVAQFLRVSPFAVRTWARTGRLPAVWLSRRVTRFRRADVLAAVGLAEAAPAAPAPARPGMPGADRRVCTWNLDDGGVQPCNR